MLVIYRISPAHPWWQPAVIQQIYPRPFREANGDGVGDLAAAKTRISYRAEPGIDAVWMSPSCSSPRHDFGYDLVGYRDVDPLAGTLPDIGEFIRQAHDPDIGRVMRARSRA